MLPTFFSSWLQNRLAQASFAADIQPATALPMTLPSGTVTFLFTDIEGSTRLWEEQREQMQSALTRHDLLLRQVIEEHGGHVFKTMGDAFYAAFATPPPPPPQRCRPSAPWPRMPS